MSSEKNRINKSQQNKLLGEKCITFDSKELLYEKRVPQLSQIEVRSNSSDQDKRKTMQSLMSKNPLNKKQK